MGRIKPVKGVFIKDDIEAFVPIGYSELAQIFKTYVDERFRACRTYGLNTVRILLEPLPAETFVETRAIGDFEDTKAFLDPVANAASRYGILLDIGAYGPFKIGLQNHPYVKHGIVTTHDELFGPTCTFMLKKRLRFLADRYRDVLFGLEFCCELEDQRDEWVDEMLTFCQELDVMCSISVCIDRGDATWAQYSHPLLPYVSMHSYIKDGLFIETLPLKYQGAAVLARRLENVERIVALVRAKAAPDKIIMDTETPRVPLSAWSRFWVRPSLVTLTQQQMEDSFFQVANRYCEFGMPPGWQWSSCMDGAWIRNAAGIKIQNGLSEGMLQQLARIKSLWG